MIKTTVEIKSAMIVWINTIKNGSRMLNFAFGIFSDIF